ncbi:MAG: 3-phosphoshikimate 1-carboxyvinyltransferase [Chloroflexi bacterium RBG_16_68_14]|nr:MAG: 3-phosphoshikimate 1-carboxyvinyltransferase [Chloroflexi bacterium RBG_16_68_14]
MERTLRRPARLQGTVRVPGDKSISHRAALLGALATGPTSVRRFLAADDCLATLDCLRALGVEWRLREKAPGVASLEVVGAGLRGLREPADVLDARNSGTTLRLLAGVLAGQPFTSVLTGDHSLRSRPVDRIVEPLRLMGAQLFARDGDRRPPLAIRGGQLRGIRYRLPVASAQVKSAVLLAGLFAEGETVVEEPVATRDHTERLLIAMGADLRREGPGLRLRPPSSLSSLDLEVPGDLSAAAFWLVAGTVHPEAEIVLPAVGVNPTRTGLLDVLAMMGATIDVGEQRMVGEEPVADITVRSSSLRGVEVAGELLPRLIDEVPALAVAAAFAEGRTVVRDAAELRVKESDRIAALTAQLRRLGATIEEQPDGFVIEGGRGLQGARVTGGGDHRLTMALAVAGLLAEGETTVEDGDAVAISYPGFWQDLERVGGC